METLAGKWFKKAECYLKLSTSLLHYRGMCLQDTELIRSRNYI